MITQQHNYVYNQHCNSVTMTFIHLLLLCCTNRMLSACSVAGVRQSRWQTVPHGRSVGCEVADCSTWHVRGMWGGRLFHTARPHNVKLCGLIDVWLSPTACIQWIQTTVMHALELLHWDTEILQIHVRRISAVDYFHKSSAMLTYWKPVKTE